MDLKTKMKFWKDHVKEETQMSHHPDVSSFEIERVNYETFSLQPPLKRFNTGFDSQYVIDQLLSLEDSCKNNGCNKALNLAKIFKLAPFLSNENTATYLQAHKA